MILCGLYLQLASRIIGTIGLKKETHETNKQANKNLWLFNFISHWKYGRILQ